MQRPTEIVNISQTPGQQITHMKETVVTTQPQQVLHHQTQPFAGGVRVIPLEAVFDTIDTHKTVDPYVMISLGNHIYKTHAHKHGGRNPVWSEYFNITNLANHTMFIQVFDKDLFTKDDLLGEAYFDFSSHIHSGKYTEHWIALQLGGKTVGKIFIAFEPRAMTEAELRQENSLKSGVDKLKEKVSTKETGVPLLTDKYHDHHFVGDEHREGIIRVKPLEAFVTESTRKKIEPYVVIRCGDRVYKSHVDKKGDHYPTWSEYFDLHGIVDKTLYIQLFDKDILSKDDLIAEGVFYLGTVLSSNKSSEHWVPLLRDGVNAGRILITCDPLAYRSEEELRDDHDRTKIKKGKILGIPAEGIPHYDAAAGYGGVLRVVPVEAIFTYGATEKTVDPFVELRCGSYKYKTHAAKNAGYHPIWSEYFNITEVQSNAIDVKVYDKDTFTISDLLGEGVFALNRILSQGGYTEYWLDLRKAGVVVGRILLGFEPRPGMTETEIREENKKKSFFERVKDKLTIHKETGIPLVTGHNVAGQTNLVEGMNVHNTAMPMHTTTMPTTMNTNMYTNMPQTVVTETETVTVTEKPSMMDKLKNKFRHHKEGEVEVVEQTTYQKY